MAVSRIRVTGGAWRSRLIEVIDAPGLRPTPDRVRETLFNWLGQDLSGQACLDLFAGSGILGFEAASRRAESVTLVERDQRVFERLGQNAARLEANVRLVHSDALKFAALAEADGSRYDLVLLDPPYRQSWLERVTPLLPGLAKPGMRLYVEAEMRVEALGDWVMVKHGQAGQVYFHLLERHE